MSVRVQYKGYNLEFASFPTPAQIQQTYEAMRARVNARLRKPGHTVIPRAERNGAVPLSYAQEWLWLVDQLKPGTSLYNLPVAVRLNGRLDIEALRQSIAEIVNRHKILRATFPIIDGNPAQVIAPSLAIELPLDDLSAMPEAEREAAARSRVAAEAARPFDLAQGPLLRVRLLRLAEQEHVIILTLHHIVSDNWSAGVIFKELAALYEAFSRGGPSPLAMLPIQYTDYACWQRQWLTRERLQSLLAYWKRQLMVAPSVLLLPTDRPRPQSPSSQGARLSFAIGKELSSRLREFSRQEGATLFMTLLAAFQTLLYRHTGQQDICIGSPIAGRNLPETEGLVGCFINTLVLRGNLSGNPKFRDFLAQIRDVTLAAYAHQELPFDQLVKELHPDRSLAQTPLYQVLFDFINGPPRNAEPSSLAMSQFDIEIPTAKMDLLLDVFDGADGLVGQIEYKTDLFDAATIKRLIERYKAILSSIVEQPGAHLNALEMFTRAEVKALQDSHLKRFREVRPSAIKIA